MDRLPWTRFHWSIVVGLGFSWVLDGLEIQIVASAGFQKEFGLSATGGRPHGDRLPHRPSVWSAHLRSLSDRLGRKKLFILTLVIYLAASGLAGLAPNFELLLVCRFIAGAGTGGEYAAINSRSTSSSRPKYRGRVDIAINGTYGAGRRSAPRRTSSS